MVNTGNSGSAVGSSASGGTLVSTGNGRARDVQQSRVGSPADVNRERAVRGGLGGTGEVESTTPTAVEEQKSMSLPAAVRNAPTQQELRGQVRQSNVAVQPTTKSPVSPTSYTSNNLPVVPGYRPQVKEAVEDLFGGGTKGGGAINPFNVGVGITEGLKKTGYKGVEVKSNAVAPSKVTVGAQEFTKPSTEYKGMSVTPEGVGGGFNTALELGAYAVPVTGAALFGTQVVTQDIPMFFNKEATTGQKVVAGIDIALAGSLVLAPKVLPKFGKSLEVQEVSMKVPSKEFKVIATNPEVVNIQKVSGEYQTNIFYKDVTGKARIGAEGKRVEVVERTFTDRLIGQGKTVYSGNPYTDKEGYNKAIEQLKKVGYSEKEARGLIRYQAPRPVEVTFQGKANTIISGTNPSTGITGKYIMNPSEIKGTRGFTSYSEVVAGSNIPIAEKAGFEISRGEQQSTKMFITSQGRPYSKISQSGRTTVSSEQLSGAKQIGEGGLNIPKDRQASTLFDFKTPQDLGSLKVSREAKGTAYQVVSGTRTTVPKSTKIDYSTSKVFVESTEGAPTTTIEAPFVVTKDLNLGGKTIGKDVKFTSEQSKSLTKSLKSIYQEPKRVSPVLDNKVVSESVAKSVPSIPKPVETKISSISSYKETFKPSESTSIYYGKGKYELTAGGALPGAYSVDTKINPNFKGITKYSEIGISKDRTSESEKTSEATKSIINTKTISGISNIPALSNPTAEKGKEVQKTNEIQKSGLGIKTELRVQPKLSSKITTELTGKVRQSINLFPAGKLPISSGKNKVTVDFGKGLSTGFKTFYYRKGKREYLPGIAPKGEAIRKGERKVLSSISARFGVEETNVPISSRDEYYSPSPSVFRNYQIVKGKRVGLKDEFIQKSGTFGEKTVRGARLASGSEVKELISFKKAKSRRFGLI